MKKIIAGLIILALSIVIGGCGVPGPWEEAGFTGDESKVISWEEWEKAGFSPETYKKYKPIFELLAAESNYFISPYKIEEFKQLGIPPEEQLNWIKEGFTSPLSIEEWYIVSEDPKIAAAWEQVFDVRDSERLREKITPEEAKKWKEAGFPAYEIEQQYKYGLNNAKIFKEFGFFGIDISYVEKVTKEISVDEYVSWVKIGLADFDVIKLYIKENLKAEDVKNWYDGGVESPYLIISMNKLKKSPEFAKKYKKLGGYYTSNLKFLKLIIGYCPDGIENNLLSGYSPFATKEKCFLYKGKVNSVRNKNSVEIEECVKTDNPFDDCMGGRVSILNFVKSIPDSMTRGSKYESIVIGGGNIEEFLFGNSSEHTDVIFPVLED